MTVFIVTDEDGCVHGVYMRAKDAQKAAMRLYRGEFNVHLPRVISRKVRKEGIMPCTVTDSLEGLAIDALQDEAYFAKKDLKNTQEELLIVTQLLCALCRICERQGIEIPKDSPIGKWWLKHKKQDRKAANGR